MRGSPVFGELLKIYGKFLHADTLFTLIRSQIFGPRSTFQQVHYVATCLFRCVTPYCIVYCSVCPLTVSFIAGTYHCPSVCPR